MNIQMHFLTRARCNADLNIKAAEQSLLLFSVKKAMPLSCCFEIKVNSSLFLLSCIISSKSVAQSCKSFKTMAISTNKTQLKCFPHSQDDKSSL